MLVGIFWVVVVRGEFILRSGGCWWMMVDLFWLVLDLFWLVVANDGFILGDGGWWWVVVGSDEFVFVMVVGGWAVFFEWWWVIVCIFWMW